MWSKKGINECTWISGANGSVTEGALMDYALTTKRMVGRLKDVHVFRGVAAGMQDCGVGRYKVRLRLLVFLGCRLRLLGFL